PPRRDRPPPEKRRRSLRNPQGPGPPRLPRRRPQTHRTRRLRRHVVSSSLRLFALRLAHRHGQGRRPLPLRAHGLGGHALPPLHLRLHRQAQGHPPHHRRLPRLHHRHRPLRLQPHPRRRPGLLVHRRHRLDHRTLLRHLRHPPQPRPHPHVRGRPKLPRPRPLLGH